MSAYRASDREAGTDCHRPGNRLSSPRLRIVTAQATGTGPGWACRFRAGLSSVGAHRRPGQVSLSELEAAGQLGWLARPGTRQASDQYLAGPGVFPGQTSESVLVYRHKVT